MCKTQFISDRDIYEQVILKEIPAAQEFVWLATSDLKDLHVKQGGKMVPFLQLLSRLIDSGVSIRMIHASEPGPRFRRDFDKYPNLIDSLERMLCPRAHLKSIVVDGRIAYTGSANLTGAGVGAKSVKNRNFEAGVVTTDPELVNGIMEQFDSIWIGSHCPNCGRQRYCSDRIE
jgi:phosphatidylserine/phosphatidylglycerophosphate/cardiolipin synthase-like enzyme